MKKQCDIGCGDVPRIREGYEGFGVDISSKVDNVKIADLTFEPIPYEDNSFDLVTAYDFLEHIPMIIYYKDGDKLVRRQCMIELFNEIYRVLKPLGEFYMQTPCYPSTQVWQDPTHQSVWLEDSLNYFSGDYFGFRDHYLHKSRFEKMPYTVENGHLCATLVARKDLPDDYPYKLHYP